MSDIRTGSQGPRGSRGPEGHRGDRGHRGHNGETGPTGPTGSGLGLLQTVADDIIANTAVTGFVFVTLLSVPITIEAGSSLLVSFSASAENTVASSQTFFHLRVDGVIQKGSEFTAGSGAGPNGQSTAIIAKITGLAAGAHTVDVQWANNGGTTTIEIPFSRGHGTLLVEEVNV